MNNLLNYVSETENSVFGFFKDNEFLAMNFPCEVIYKGIIYPSAANAFFSERCETEDQKAKIETLEPYRVKEYARTLPIPSNWIDKRAEVMGEVIFNKFESEELTKKLLKTGNKKLINANHWNDTFWGTNEAGRGENKLGDILDSVRAKKNSESKVTKIQVTQVTQVPKEEVQNSGFSLKNFKKGKR